MTLGNRDQLLISSGEMKEEKYVTPDGKRLVRRPHLFKPSVNAEQQIYYLVYSAAKVETLESVVKNLPKDEHLLETLISAAKIGIKNCDIKYNASRGIVEHIFDWILLYFPNDFIESLDEIERFVPRETEDQKNAREKANLRAVQELYSTYYKNREEIVKTYNATRDVTRIQPQHDLNTKALENFAKFVEQLSPLNVINVYIHMLNERKYAAEKHPFMASIEDKFMTDALCIVDAHLSMRQRQILSMGEEALKGDYRVDRGASIPYSEIKSFTYSRLFVRYYERLCRYRPIETGYGCTRAELDKGNTLGFR